MSFAEITTPAELLCLLGRHQDIAYLVMFLGAFCETLIPLSFFIYGEIFFITGALMAGAGTLDWWAVATALYSGGILGDNASYWLGRLFGMQLFDRLAGWPLTGRFMQRFSYQRGVQMFQRRGPLAVLLARLAGPLSWTVPCLAGTFRLNYPTFLLANTVGVFVGIGQFLVVGYLVGDTLVSIMNEISRHNLLLPALMVLAVLALLPVCRRRGAGQTG